MLEIDVKGLACPEPVVRTMQALLKSPEGVRVMGDSVASKENISRFAAAKKYNIAIEEQGDVYVLTLTK